ncbi:MAG: hypothetical protein JWO74_1922 [Solirubrobacterales bacterium]|nr:hypothetical protein [Solirubrobacterales bacterium]
MRLWTEGARSFRSDGVRYVVYVHRLPGERDSSRPVMIVDTAKTIPVIDNVYAFTTTQPARISYTDAHGTTHTLRGAIDPGPR